MLPVGHGASRPRQINHNLCDDSTARPRAQNNDPVRQRHRFGKIVGAQQSALLCSHPDQSSQQQILELRFGLNIQPPNGSSMSRIRSQAQTLRAGAQALAHSMRVLLDSGERNSLSLGTLRSRSIARSSRSFLAILRSSIP